MERPKHVTLAQFDGLSIFLVGNIDDITQTLMNGKDTTVITATNAVTNKRVLLNMNQLQGLVELDDDEIDTVMAEDAYTSTPIKITA